MKRAGALIELIADPENLRLAFWKARRGKDARPEVAEFRRGLDRRLHALREELLTGEVTVGNYRYFSVFEPKERLICAAAFRERVLHHAVMNVCHGWFERFQVFDSYATRPGKGQYAALDRARGFTRCYPWFCKLDVRKFFDSVPHERLLALLERRFKDRVLLRVFRRVVESYAATPGRGLPIGNLTSQYFANFYLAHADHHLQERLGVPAYVRYMDDMLLFHDSREELTRLVRRFSSYIDVELDLRLKPAVLNATRFGVPFLGYVLFPGEARLNRGSKKRFTRKLKEYALLLEGGEWTEGEYARHVEPLVAFTRYARANGLRRTLLMQGAG